VPLIWAWGDELAQGETREDLVELVDVYPTLCDLAGVEQPGDQLQGQSLAASLTDGTPVDREAAFAVHGDTRTIRTDDWRLVYHADDELGELYDERADPWELDNLWDDPEHQRQRADLLGRLHEFLAKTERRVPRTAGNLSGEAVTAVWSGKWWEQTGEVNPSPLAHLGMPELSEEE
jgi:arylsulfatase A-like enzyme